MNLVNDRFSAGVYSSYGEMSRNTPVHDFEKIGLEPAKLFCGSLIGAIDLRSNHYHSKSKRISRAISQLQKPEECLKLLEEMFMDKDLDTYNRMLAWYTSYNYSRYAKDPIRSKEKLALLDEIQVGMSERFRNSKK